MLIVTARRALYDPIGFVVIFAGGVIIYNGTEVTLNDAVNRVDAVIIEDTVRVDNGRSWVTDREDTVSKEDTVRVDSGRSSVTDRVDVVSKEDTVRVDSG